MPCCVYPNSTKRRFNTLPSFPSLKESLATDVDRSALETVRMLGMVAARRNPDYLTLGAGFVEVAEVRGERPAGF